MNKNGGINFTVKANFDDAAARARIGTAVHRAQMVLDQQVMTDSNYYVPIKTHTLEASSAINTVIGSGLVVWKTPYARRQYYGIGFDHSKQLNPNATARWFEAAKSRRLAQWTRLVNDAVKHS